MRVWTCHHFRPFKSKYIVSCTMKNTCAVGICKSSHNQSGICFYRFPAEKSAREAWLLSCGLDESFDCSQGRVCSLHFTDDDYERDLRHELLGEPQKKRLKEGVVPHFNLVQIKLEPIYLDDFEVEGDTSLPSTSHSSGSAAASTTSDLDNSHFDNTTDPSNNLSIEMIPLEPIRNASAIFIPNSAVISSNLNYVPSSLPGSENWPGDYNFAVSFNPQEKNTKGVTWTYSKIKDKLYVGKDVPCPINFSANTAPSDNVSVRVMALYGSPEHASEVVKRCLNHSMEEMEKQIFEAEHLVRCESKMASYKMDPTTRRHSVVVPFEIPAVGQHYSTYIYRFACFGSCAGGPNRRPIMLIFSLEKDGEVVGRRRLDVKICACPGRDRKGEEQQLESQEPTKRKESEMVSLADTLEFTKYIKLPPTKKVKQSPGKTYIIRADSQEQYDFLIQMKNFFDMCKSMNNLPPSVRSALALMGSKKNLEGDSS